ncbi:MAG TPA: NADH-quinone oxidoreductase subunit C [Bacilli bacterium]
MSDEQKQPQAEKAENSAQQLKEQAAETSRPPRSEAVVMQDGTANEKAAGAAPAAAAGDAAETASEKPERPARPPRAAAAGDAGATPAAGDAAAAAREARAKERAARKAAEENAAPKEPSPEQPRLDRLVQIIKEEVGEEAVESAVVNELSKHLPTVYVKAEYWDKVARLLRDHDELQLHYLRNMTGIDAETHMEVAYHLLSLVSKREYCVKVKTDRDRPSISSVTAIWSAANWNEREIYDLLGIDFPGHPDLRRIMLPDDWVGHPLRKDYVPVDPEV